MAAAAIAPASNVSAAPNEQSAAITNLFEYLRNHNSTAFLVIQDGKVLLEKSWPAPEGDRQFSIFVHGRSTQGALLEDVASRWRDPLFAGPALAI